MSASSGRRLPAEVSRSIPAKAAAPRGADALASQAEPAPPRRVLIVEDDADVRDSLQALLTLLGHHVEEAADGPQGLEKLLALRPDVAL